jgi:hypothetical protein
MARLSELLPPCRGWKGPVQCIQLPCAGPPSKRKVDKPKPTPPPRNLRYFPSNVAVSFVPATKFDENNAQADEGKS